MPRVVHFEISADDMERAEKFYTDVFGWQFTKWEGDDNPEPYRLVKTGEQDEHGIDGGMFQRRGSMTGHVNTVAVPNVDEYAERVTGSGGKVVVPKMAIPGVGHLVYCQDTEGSLFGIIQMDHSAA